jgi:hypothetical protein
MSVLVPLLDDDEGRLLAYLRENSQISHDDEQGEFRRALDLEVFHRDERAQVDDVTINAVEIDEDEISVSYTVHWSAHYTCSDQCHDGFEDLVAEGVRTDDGWEFAEPEPMPPREPDEY